MSAICDLALVAGVTLFGYCDKAMPENVPDLPKDERAAWSLPPAPPAPPAPKAPVMPPIVIKKEVLVERKAPPPPPPPKAPPAPDSVKLAIEAAWSGGSINLSPAGNPSVTVSYSPAPKAAAPGLLAPNADPLAISAAGIEKEQYESPGSTSTRPVDNERILAADRYISGIVETGVNSQVGGDDEGSIIIQTSRDVYGYHGRLVLVPKGSRMICKFLPPKDMGSSRLEMKCERILLAGHRAEIRDLGASVGNAQGQAGVSGDVDRRFWERYGTAIMLTGLATAVRFAAATASTDATDTTTAASEKAAEELSSRFGEITASVLEETLSLVPIITIPQGTRVQIRPATDWYIADWKQS
jgi:type IV secretion system protein VirB10|tara:strand:+ start:1087 stop:2154 length:1068 start_codon:yes stop_codon:yes gene_type:complete